jgi:hypothetical protein
MADYVSTCGLDMGILANGDDSHDGGGDGPDIDGEYVLTWTDGILNRAHSGVSAHDGGDDLAAWGGGLLGAQGGSGLSAAADDALGMVGSGATLCSGGDVLGDGGRLLGEVTVNLGGSGAMRGQRRRPGWEWR